MSFEALLSYLVHSQINITNASVLLSVVSDICVKAQIVLQDQCVQRDPQNPL